MYSNCVKPLKLKTVSEQTLYLTLEYITKTKTSRSAERIFTFFRINLKRVVVVEYHIQESW